MRAVRQCRVAMRAVLARIHATTPGDAVQWPAEPAGPREAARMVSGAPNAPRMRARRAVDPGLAARLRKGHARASGGRRGAARFLALQSICRSGLSAAAPSQEAVHVAKQQAFEAVRA